MHLGPDRVARLQILRTDLEQAAVWLSRPVRLMEVCGTHSHVIGRWGLRQVLPEGVELTSGPGCPVCVTTGGQVEMALELARCGIIMVTFGDMMRVPGPSGSLAQARAAGCDVRAVYSPAQALDIALAEPAREVVFLAVGFETTAPSVASVVKQTAEAGLRNVSFLSLHKLIPPALEALMDNRDSRIDGLLSPGHVSVVIGTEAYRGLAETHGVPCVVAGFEPEDILRAVTMLLGLVATRRVDVLNAYPRAVTPGGNRTAQALMAEVFEARAADWRGLGKIDGSGLALRERYAGLDAAVRFGLVETAVADPPGCRCGDVLRGLLRPQECCLFAQACTPEAPVGPCMVSSEGACAAAYRYERLEVGGTDLDLEASLAAASLGRRSR
ncbi:MAG: hydrogenase formation protein HypD [Armatimonadota bacterium]